MCLCFLVTILHLYFLNLIKPDQIPSPPPLPPHPPKNKKKENEKRNRSKNIFNCTFVFPGICSAILSHRLSIPFGKWRRAHSKITCWFWVHESGPSFPPPCSVLLPPSPPPTSLSPLPSSVCPRLLEEESLEGTDCGIINVLSAVLWFFVGLRRCLVSVCVLSVSAVVAPLPSAVVMMLSLMCWFFFAILLLVFASTFPVNLTRSTKTYNR